jgi:hypothetical protein
MLGDLRVLWCYAVLSGKQLHTVRLECSSVVLWETHYLTMQTCHKIHWTERLVKKIVKFLSIHVTLTKLTFRVRYISSSCYSIIFGTHVTGVCRIFSSLKTYSSHVLNCGLCSIPSGRVSSSRSPHWLRPANNYIHIGQGLRGSTGS